VSVKIVAHRLQINLIRLAVAESVQINQPVNATIPIRKEGPQ
jgi:hypothetical protein